MKPRGLFGSRPLAKQSLEVAIELLKVFMHVDDIACAHQSTGRWSGLAVDLLFGVLRERDLKASGMAHFLEHVPGFSRIAIIKHRGDQIAVVAITARDGDHPISAFPADHLEVIGAKVAMTDGAAIHAIENVSFNLLFG
jgi:hypothetical protein